MPNDKETNNPYVSRSFCNERFNRTLDKLESIEHKIDDQAKQRWQPKDYATIFTALLALFGSMTAAYFAYLSSII